MSEVTIPPAFPNPLEEVNVWSKIDALHAKAHHLLTTPRAFHRPTLPGREVPVRPLSQHPPKGGLSLKEGRARLLHDLTSIELQAMELGVRTLLEFPEAPSAFREELLRVTLEESRHLKLCLEGLEQLGFSFGTWPTHLTLWNCVSEEDSLLDRVLIVHRYLEGSGLDASDALLRRLTGVKDEKVVTPVVRVIAEEELGHVEFGSRWYRVLCARRKIDPQQDFGARMTRLKEKIPRRLIPLNPSLRKKAGFTDGELSVLEELQAYFREER
jgi:uncharacterized ferritin-like protein (DUF455 family)